MVLQSFTAKIDDPTFVATFQDFIAISCVAEKYFYQQKLIGSAILAGKVDPETRDNFFVPSIVDSITRTLPRVYKTLHSIASANGFMYDVELKDENYQELYLVAAKYGATAGTGPAEKSSVA